MSLISKNKKERKEIGKRFEKELAELFKAWECEKKPLKDMEENQMSKLIAYLKKQEKALTARQIYELQSEIGTDMTIMEIAGNLLELERFRGYGQHSRYETFNKTGRTHEIEAHTTFQKWCLLDENGEPTKVVKEVNTGVNAYKLKEKEKPYGNYNEKRYW